MIGPWTKRKQSLELFLSAQNPIAVGLIDDQDVTNLHNAGFHRLHVISHARHQHDHTDVRSFGNLDFILTDTDGLNDDFFIAGRIEDRRGFDG